MFTLCVGLTVILKYFIVVNSICNFYMPSHDLTHVLNTTQMWTTSVYLYAIVKGERLNPNSPLIICLGVLFYRYFLSLCVFRAIF